MIITTNFNLSLLMQVAVLHYESLQGWGFLTGMGPKFLFHLYRSLLAGQDAFIVLAVEKDNVMGFTVGCLDSSRIIGKILRRPLTFFPLMAIACLKRPNLVLKVFQAPLYSKKVICQIKAELFAIVIHEKVRGRGVGTRLVVQLEQEFHSRNIGEYKVSTYDELSGANNFYFKNRFALSESFKLYGTLFNLYVKKIIPQRQIPKEIYIDAQN